MTQLIFFLGNTPELSLAELQSVVDPQVKLLAPKLASLAVSKQESIDLSETLIQRLGGSLKIGVMLDQAPSDTNPSDWSSIILDHLEKLALENEGKVEFVIAEQGRDHLPVLDPSQFKKSLKKMGLRARYIEAPRSGASTALLAHQPQVKELTLINTESQTVLVQTLVAQPLDDWVKRDRQKPFADRKKGLLPPKVARMMVNLALENESSEERTLLDPFCGSGTILMEAALLGLKASGSDHDQASVDGAKENIAWLNQQNQLKIVPEVLKADAAHLQLPPSSIDYLVTEPFLGKPTPKPRELANIFTGLYKLYLGAFKSWRSFLKPKAKVVIVFPAVKEVNKRYDLKKLIDKIAQFGYIADLGPIFYARPQAIVSREVYRFTYQPKNDQPEDVGAK